MKCETDGCENEARNRMRHCDDCIVAKARKLKRERETTESGVRGGQGRSGREVEESAAIGGLCMVLLLIIVMAAAVYKGVTDGFEAADEARQVQAEMVEGGE